MPAHAKRTKAVTTKLRALHAAGESGREMARQLGVDNRTLRRWLEEVGLTSAEPSAPASPRGAAPARGVSPEVSARIAAAADAPLEERAQVITIVQTRLRAVGTLLEDLTAQVSKKEFSATAYAQIVRLEDFLARSLVDMTPPERVDPELDPANVEAATAVRGRLARLVEQAERSSLCLHCGKPPFVKESQ
jgi:hypothetical protein